MTKMTILVSRIVAALMLAGLIGCEQAEQAQDRERTQSINASIVRLSNHSVRQFFTGSVEGERQADIHAKLTEAVEKVNVSEGQQVQVGQVLISLDKTGPSSMYREAESVARNADKNFKKMEFLYKEGAISESQYDASRTEYEVRQATFEAAAALVDVESPINGIVTSVDVRPGDMVQIGQKVATVATTDRLRVKLAVGAREAAFLKKGDTVSVITDGDTETTSGVVVAIAGSADPATRAFEVEVLIDNKASTIQPGVFVRVAVTLAELKDVIIVPRSSVLNLDGVPSAFVVVDGKAHRRAVNLGADLDGQVAVTSGLTAGDTLVTLGQTYLDDGTAVKIVEMENRGR
jgi:RND family efflux transporter MFP subunit